MKKPQKQTPSSDVSPGASHALGLYLLKYLKGCLTSYLYVLLCVNLEE